MYTWMCPVDVDLQLWVNQMVGDVAIGEQACCWFTDGGGRGAGGGGFRQSEIESEIATACNHALAILLQIAQLNLQCAPTGQLLLFPKFNHKRILSLPIRGRIQYWKSIGSARPRFCENYETQFALFLENLIHWGYCQLLCDKWIYIVQRDFFLFANTCKGSSFRAFVNSILSFANSPSYILQKVSQYVEFFLS